MADEPEVAFDPMVTQFNTGPITDFSGMFGTPDFTTFPGGFGVPAGTGALDFNTEVGQQWFLDTQTGQVVTGQQAQQIDPASYNRILQVLQAGKNALNAANQQAGGGNNSGLSLQQLAGLPVAGAGVAGILGGLGYNLSRGTPSAPGAPPPTGTQQELLAAQTAALQQYQQQLAQQNAVAQPTLPAMLARAGLVPNAQGGYSDLYGGGIQQATLGNLGLAQNYQNLAQQTTGQDLTKINPALTEYLNDQMRQFEQGARSQFGPGYQESTPYQNALYYQNLGRTNSLVGNQLNYLNSYQNLANAAFTGSQVAPGTTAGALQTAAGPTAQYGNLVQAFSNPLASLQSQQLLGYQGQLNQYNANVAQGAALGSALGQAGTGLGQLGVGLGQSGALGALLKGLG